MVLLVGCTEGRIQYAEKWTKEIKAKILEDAYQPATLIEEQTLDDSTSRFTFYSDSVMLRRATVRKTTGDTLSAAYFSTDDKFALGREFCALLGDEWVEVIIYNRMTVGVHNLYYCDGKLKKSGLNIAGMVGEWRDYDRSGKVIRTTDHGNLEKLDTLRKIKYYR